ncbi:Fc.00g059910.m01.CDS01 [Cosmosporella sp. VM-42]
MEWMQGDDEKPECARCVKKGIKCTREINIRFRHVSNPSRAFNGHRPKKCEFSFAVNQIWCTTDTELTFIDEGRDLEVIYGKGEGSEGNDDQPTSQLIEDSESNIFLNTDLCEAGAHESPQTEPGCLASERVRPEQRSGVEPILSDQHSSSPSSHLQPSSHTAIVYTSSTSSITQPLYHGISLWPIQEPNEANLIRYFIKHISRRFDLCDPKRHFALVVPCRAATCPPLMNAAFALSALYLSRTTNFDEYVSHRYYQKCLNSLVPMFGNPMALVDENLFAATVILRTLEEIEVPLSGADSRTHLLGSHLFVGASTLTDSSTSATSDFLKPSPLTGLQRASLLVAFRQEVYMAFVSQRAVAPAFNLPDVDRSLSNPADDSTWTNRILLHIVDALKFCYGGEGTPSNRIKEWYDELVAYGEQWYEKTPPSFRPIYIKELGSHFLQSQNSYGGIGSTETGLFPEVWLLSDAVATGILNYHLSRILLLAFNPRTPRIGPSRTGFIRRQNEDIKYHVKMLAGIAGGNADCAPNFVLACMGITMAGERFEERREQQELMNFLKKTEVEYAWSTDTAQRHLAEAWDWDENEW